VFGRVLIANRGEIACRITSTLRNMGVESVAVYTDADAGSTHVRLADHAVRIGEGPVATSYLDVGVILDAAQSTGADAVHPGYGLLSENAAFAQACTDTGLTWIGPDPDHIRRFGSKHLARELARELGVSLLPGSELLASTHEAVAAATAIGYPVLLKPTAGGGGIGMQRCGSEAEVATAFDAVARVAQQNFGAAGVLVERFVERARHIEVQIFGTAGEIVTLGERDCSAQRRHQKVIEEAPPPALALTALAGVRENALRLARAVGYRSAGTVEFVVDADRQSWAFLEVNTRLQVEHGVTELVTGIDLVEWMILEAAGELEGLAQRVAATRGAGRAAIEVRVYAEDPQHGGRPQTGELVEVEFPPDVRVDTWVERGTEITPFYDPLLAKILVAGDDRGEAIEALGNALRSTRLDGVITNLAFVTAAINDRRFVEGRYTTTFLEGIGHRLPTIEVLDGGMQTTVQDDPGRLDYWAIGVPPSGPMDDRSFRLANRLVGNDPGAAGLEIIVTGPTLRFDVPAEIVIAGASVEASIDGTAVPAWEVVAIPAGATLLLGSVTGPGCRAYLCVGGGIDVPRYLGSRSTFLLGRFGGYRGRAVTTGDVLAIGLHQSGKPVAGTRLTNDLLPELGHSWTIGVVDGPHAAPDFLTASGFDAFVTSTWTVHHHSDRTGVRLIGPAPDWARADGGEAGLHPSNIHDTPYTVGAVDLTGDMPIILGPDGPSLGGFVCPVTVAKAERWKVGQLTAGDTVRFVRTQAGRPRPIVRARPGAATPNAASDHPSVTYRRSGDECVLVEYGDNILDLGLRFRVHALMQAIDEAAMPGIAELAPGIRSLQVRFDPAVITVDRLVDALERVEAGLPPDTDLTVPSRVVHLPLSWDDPATRLATERYMKVVRDDAPWCPWNIEFIRRINGLGSVDDVRRIVFDASYLVLGLGDVYLGAPVATPLDPRHRLVTTKYNPARTWTPENAVGIGGAYLCVYGMDGPGGYQFVGRTVQMWNRHRRTPDFPGAERWLLRFFDQLRFFPVGADELLALRRDFAYGRYRLDIDESELSLASYRSFLAEDATTIEAFKQDQQTAFDAERRRWETSGEMDRVASLLRQDPAPPEDVEEASSDGAIVVKSPIHGVVAHVAAVGEQVTAGTSVAVIEAMKMETQLPSPVRGVIRDVRCRSGQVVAPGRSLVVVEPDRGAVP
jgi:urea carboxylase